MSIHIGVLDICQKISILKKPNLKDLTCTDLLFFLGISEAQIRVLRTRLRIMQEEMEQASSEFYKKVLQELLNISNYSLTFIDAAQDEVRFGRSGSCKSWSIMDYGY